MTVDSAHDVSVEEGRLQRHLGIGGLTAIGFSNIVGSGWLFAAMYAAQIAGPAALLAWVLAGLFVGLVALVFVELGGARPEGGSTARWPLYASGRLTGSVIGVSVLLSVGATSAELTAIIQYADHYLPGLYVDKTLTPAGVATAVVLSVVLTGLNWFGVRLFDRVNTTVTVIKVVIPLLTVVLLLASGFDGGHLTEHGGFAPSGYGAVLTALAGGGVVYAVNGFQAPVDFSGEARNAHRTIPLAVLGSIAAAVLLYLGLQLAYLGAVPDALLAHGWSGVDLDSPFGELAVALNLGWLAALLYGDAVISPGGSALVGVALNARHTYALAKNRLLPRALMVVNPRWGVPRRALALNLAVIVVFLLPFRGWQQIVGVVGTLFVLLYLSAAVAVEVFRRREPDRLAGWVPGMRWIAPVAFVLATEIVYWAGFDDLRYALPLTLVGVPLFVLLWRGDRVGSLVSELRAGAWIVVHLLVITLLSGLGTFGGAEVLPAPWDTVVVAVWSLAVFPWAVHEGVRSGGTTTAVPEPVTGADDPAAP